ncbi:MAG TPA: imidazoleglycerol-phosphate dehydratase, partial [Candidatus Scatomorpha stercorigallinarum]|nr:imidazoleglycerol-phosphate dehydratase [Candidatus Scatomorpha stercorigallinarum]
RYTAQIPRARVGDFDTELAREFMQALANSAGMALHIRQLDGENSHHIIEAMFKALGRALSEAAEIVGTEVPSTKGVL